MTIRKALVGLMIMTLLLAFAPYRAAIGYAAPSASIHGLKAEYYTNSGAPNFNFLDLKATIIDPNIHFGSLEGVFQQLTGQQDLVNVRWTGNITAPATDDYTFYMIGDNGFRMWIDDRIVIDHWIDDWDKEITSAPVLLEAGKAYSFKVEYFENHGGSNLFLRWSGKDIAKQIVPAEAFTLPSGFEYDGPISGFVASDGLHAEMSFAKPLQPLGDKLTEQLTVSVQGIPWPLTEAKLDAADAGKLLVTFEYPVYSRDAETVVVRYDGEGALSYSGEESKVASFYFPMRNLSEYSIESPWAAQLDPNLPLPEYPRPQMERSDWLNLNGKWEFQAAKEGDPLPSGQKLKETIVVPFAAESKLSGIERYEPLMWYKRSFEVPQDWDGKRVRLNFGAVDYLATVYVNGMKAGTHKGGYTAFSFDITDYLRAGENELIVHVLDETDMGQDQVVGKQTAKKPGGIWYTSVSGIWQTVWLEPVNDAHILRMDMVPNIDAGTLELKAETSGGAGKVIEAVAYADGVEVGRVSGDASSVLSVPVPQPRLWSPDDPFLYDLKVVLKDGNETVDRIGSYFGMREISLGLVDGVLRPLLNGEFIFQMGPLDQGYWPDGLYTAPTDDALKFDIETVKRLDMNMIRKHIKVEPARWYYWADKLGVLVWQDMPSLEDRQGNQGRDIGQAAKDQFFQEYDEMILQLQNVPSIIVYTVFNEGWGQFDAGGEQTRNAIEHVKKADPTRLINGASGWWDAGGGDNEARAGHLIDFHSYPAPNSPVPSAHRAAVLGEYGGLGLHVPGHEWSPLVFSYQLMQSKQQLTDNYVSFIKDVKRLKETKGLSAAVYTQITDVEYEINGLLTYDRKVEKLDFKQVAAAHRDLLGTVGAADLHEAIQKALGFAGKVKVGDGPGQYPEQAKEAFLAVIAEAQAAANKANASADELKQALSALQEGLAQFRAAGHDPVSSQSEIDSFDKEQLDASWTIVNENRGSWSLTENAGQLTIHSTKGDLFEKQNSLENIFLKDPGADDFEITAKIDADISRNFQQAGLLVYQDMDNYVKFAHAWDTEGSTGKSLETAFERNAVYKKATNMAKHPGDNSVYLKIRKEGNVYTTFYWDGAEWVQAADPITVSLTNPKVGLYTFSATDSTSVTSLYSYFEINRTKEEPEPEINYDLNGDGHIGTGDLAILSRWYGANSEHENWMANMHADLNGDLQIDIEDIRLMAVNVFAAMRASQ